MEDNVRYYCVGYYWSGSDSTDQLPRFLKDGIWENGYDDKFLKTVTDIPIGSRLAAKKTYTRKENGKSISVIEINALGTVTGNPKDGQTLKVKWDKDFKPFTILGKGGYRSTISQVNNPENIRLIFNNNRPGNAPNLSSAESDILNNFPANLILAGPPGTGKTYNTISKAIAIVDGINEDSLIKYYSNRTFLKDRFDELLIEDWDNPDGQIAFVTFHQSMNYEDFVEGIKPILNDNEVAYDIEPGIFKRIANRAQNNWLDAQKGNKGNLSFEEAFSKLHEAWEEDREMRFSMKTKGKEFKITGFTKSSINFRKASGGEQHTLSINTLRDYYFGKKAVRKAGVGIYYPGVLEKLKAFQPDDTIEKEEKRYVIIIDEINRGNIAQIFGELITLIEDDKRLGKREELSVILPYSKEKFIVPQNLHIIGTMNTADRSVEALDIALRRRFSIDEKAPDYKLLTPERMLWKFWWDYEHVDWGNKEFEEKEILFYTLLGAPQEFNNDDIKDTYWQPMRKQGPNEEQVMSLASISFSGINLSKLLLFINMRIEKLLNKDYKIGHAYFINIASLNDLRTVFGNKIMPLLQEYFFNDYGRIGWVVGEVFITKADSGFDVKLMPVKGYSPGDINQARMYEIQNVIAWEDQFFIKNIKAIYGE